MAAHSVTNLAAVLLLHSRSFCISFRRWHCFYFREEKQSTTAALSSESFKSLHCLVTNDTDWSTVILLMRQIICWLALNAATLTGHLWLYAFWHFIIPQTVGISFNCISHWHLTWFTKHYRSDSVSLLTECLKEKQRFKVHNNYPTSSTAFFLSKESVFVVVGSWWWVTNVNIIVIIVLLIIRRKPRCRQHFSHAATICMDHMLTLNLAIEP